MYYYFISLPFYHTTTRSAVSSRRKRALITEFLAEHPFLYFIYSESQNITLFMGTYLNCAVSNLDLHDEL